MHPLSQVRTTHFEVTILSNRDPKGALAIGVCGHIPKGQEVHSVHLDNSAMYVSDSGLVGNIPSKQEVNGAVKEPLSEGLVLVVGYNPEEKVITWYLDGNVLATATIPPELVSKCRTVYPVFALYIPDQKIQVQFDKEREEAAV